jgi:hypothetical protein
MKSDLVAVELSGGLGNQLFQYAAGLSLARRHHASRVDDEYLDERVVASAKLMLLRFDLGVSLFPGLGRRRAESRPCRRAVQIAPDSRG